MDLLYLELQKGKRNQGCRLHKGEDMTQEIMGTAEIGAWLGVTRQEVAQWKFQGKLPNPDYQLKATPVWKKKHIT